AAARQDGANFALRPGTQIGIDQPPLASAFKPYAPGRSQRNAERFAVGYLPVAGVQPGQVLRPGLGERGFLQPAVGNAAVLLGSRDYNDGSLGSSGKLEETADHLRSELPAAHHQQTAIGRADRLRQRQRGREKTETNETHHGYS